MQKAIHLVSIAGLWISWVTIALAHPGGHARSELSNGSGSRTWTLAEGGARWRGDFVAVNGGAARIQQRDGQVISIAMEQLVEHDRLWIEVLRQRIERVNGSEPRLLLAQSGTGQRSGQQTKPPQAPFIHRHFLPFRDSLGLRWNDRFYFVESNGLPDHPMMIGIIAWQQQVPLPQRYTGDNAWQIPLHPVPAKQPMSAKTGFFRGAIALAVNGVPIFNPIKNDGRTDTLLAGELDQWGGHCGRGDDYHYHLAPVHLEKVVGAGQPIAYALDGYPILGYQDEKAPDFAPLDWLNGHKDADGRYHYHATKTYPYLNGGFYGEVVERDGQVDPQPRASSPRESLPPLRGATITGFTRSDDGNSSNVTYELRGEKRAVRYVVDAGKSVEFTFDNGRDGTREETYQFQSVGRRGGGDHPPRGPRPQQPQPGRQPPPPPPRGGDAPPPRRGDAPPERQRVEDRRQPAEQRPGGREQAASDEPRRPWLVVHADEMDTNADGILTKAELEAEVRKAFTAYDADQDGTLLVSELAASRPVRSAMGGFIREHREELDRNDDGRLTQDEILQTAARMFDKADADRNGQILIAAAASESKADSPSPQAQPQAQQPQSAVQKNRETAARPQMPAGPPNIVFILVDDLGWRDVGFAGNDFVETPHIDRLAAEGIAFTQAYASAPNCAPTRACLMSGQYTPRHGVYTVIDPRHDPGQPHHRILSARSEEALSGETITIAELLQKRGYATACFGMWNLGRGKNGPTTPTGQGFDSYLRPKELGFDQNEYFSADDRYLTDVLFDEGLKFIETHSQQPFFLYLPTHAVHAPFEPKPELVEKYREKARRLELEDADPVYAATIEAVDRNVGRLLSSLERLQLSDNTLIVFTSDNGGTPQYVAPLNGSKGALYEGGIRVPCAVWWNGIEKPGRTCAEPILSMDFYSTLAELAGVDLPVGQSIDGVSLLPLLKQTDELNRAAVFWHFPCYIGRGEPCSAVRSGDWKLIQKFEDRSVELFNLRSDPGETRNLADTDTSRTREMSSLLTNWQKSLAAPLPSEPNPSFDPETIRRGRRPLRGNGQGSESRPQTGSLLRPRQSSE